MSPDQSTGASSGDTPGEAALREVLRAHVTATGVPRAQVRQALRIVCDEAHRGNVPAEQLLVRLKNMWASMPEVHQLESRATGRQLLSNVVSLCIDEYFRDRP